MKKERFQITISDSLGVVSAEKVEPLEFDSVLVIAHGAGAGMDHKFMKTLAVGLAEQGVATVRFNFVYMENKKGRPDPGPIAEKTVSRVLETVKSMYPGLPIFVSGKSFGGRMTSNMLSKGSISGIEGIIFYGFPLHPAGKPSTERAEHLKNVKIPMLFLQGTRDALAELSLIRQVAEPLENATLTLFEGADHSFAIGKKDVVSELILASVKWMRWKLRIFATYNP